MAFPHQSRRLRRSLTFLLLWYLKSSAASMQRNSASFPVCPLSSTGLHLNINAGGTDGFIQCWKAVEDLPRLFDLAGSHSHTTNNSELVFQLWEHQGPVTCLALDPFRIYSGSWDMTVRVWDRSLFKCTKVLRHNDWVCSLVPRGSTVATSAGADVYFWDVDTGDLVSILRNALVGNTCSSLARSHIGDLLFTGGDDGSISMFELFTSPRD